MKTKLTEKEFEFTRNEISIMSVCQNENIVQVFEVLENEEFLYIIMERLNGGDLYEYLKKNKNVITEERVRIIFYSVLLAINYIHSFGIVHRDIKLNNILLVEDSLHSKVKLIDFGFAKIITPNEVCNEPIGTLLYASPELLLKQNYGFSVDIWNLGICLFFMLSGDFPFKSNKNNDSELIELIKNKPPEFIDNHWEKISSEAKDLVLKMLEKDPLKRIPIKEIFTHKWLLLDTNKKI